MSYHNLTEFELARPLTKAELKSYDEYQDRRANDTNLNVKKNEIISIRDTASANPFRRAFAPGEFKQLFKEYQREIINLEAERLTYELKPWEDAEHTKLDARIQWHKKLAEFRHQVERSAFETFGISQLVHTSRGYNLPAMLEQYDNVKTLCSTDGLLQFARRKQRYAQDALLQLEQEDSALWLALDPDKQLGEARRAVLGEIIGKLFTSFLEHVAKDLTERLLAANEEVPVVQRAQYDQPGVLLAAGDETASKAEANNALRSILPEAALINEQILTAQLPYYQPGDTNFSDSNPLTLRLNTGNQEVDDAWQRVVGWLSDVWGYEPITPRWVDESLNKGKLYSSELVRLKREIQLVYNAHPLYVEELRLHLLGFNRSVISSLAHEHEGEETINPGPVALLIEKLHYAGQRPTHVPPLILDEGNVWAKIRLLTAVELHDFLLNSSIAFYTPSDFLLPTWIRERALMPASDEDAPSSKDSVNTGSASQQSQNTDPRDLGSIDYLFVNSFNTELCDKLAKEVGLLPPNMPWEKISHGKAKLWALVAALKERGLLKDDYPPEAVESI